MTSSQSQNPYVYCLNNPLRYIDPSGMMATQEEIERMLNDENYEHDYLPLIETVEEIIEFVEDVKEEIIEFVEDVKEEIEKDTSPDWTKDVVPGTTSSIPNDYYGGDVNTDDYSWGTVTSIEVNVYVQKENVPVGLGVQKNYVTNTQGKDGKAESRIYSELQVVLPIRQPNIRKVGANVNIPMTSDSSFEEYESRPPRSGGVGYNSQYWIGIGGKLDAEWNFTPFLSFGPPGGYIFFSYRLPYWER